MAPLCQSTNFCCIPNLEIPLHSSRSKLLTVILASLVLHALLVYLIAQRAIFNTSVSAEDSRVNAPIEPIKARLLLPPIPVNEVIEDEQPTLVVPPAVKQQVNRPPVTKADAATNPKTTPSLPASAPVPAPNPAPVVGKTSDKLKQSAALILSAGEMAKQQMQGFQQRLARCSVTAGGNELSTTKKFSRTQRKKA